MLFNSYEFLFVFLPLTWLVTQGLRRVAGGAAALGALGIASLIFYGYWNPVYVPLLLGSVLFNFAVGSALVRRAEGRGRRAALVFGVTVNLVVLGYFKYYDFFLENLSSVLGTELAAAHVVLPLAISFFTFQQIAFLADAGHGRIGDLSFLRYFVFVTFFPQLIAGPIVHHGEVVPQLSPEQPRPLRADLCVGLSILTIGLFKKVVLADGLAAYADPVFGAAATGSTPALLESWAGTLAFSFQIYFDFSGYSDMAIGLARMFGVLLPLNFNSPYKATSIVEFWDRWHMTLTRFLRDHVYVALGSLRQPVSRRHANLLLTMTLCGLWHGAGWGFVIWGGLHGTLLVATHLWRALKHRAGLGAAPAAWRVGGARLLTFLVVTLALVLFRSPDLASAGLLFRGLFGGAGLGPIESGLFHGAREAGVILTVWAGVWLLPNTQEFVSGFEPALDWRRWARRPDWSPLFGRARWRPSVAYSGFIALLAATALTLAAKERAFVYFQF